MPLLTNSCGEPFIEGPSGAGGHAANASGFDGVAYSLKLDDLVIPDNKSFQSPGNVGRATAIDPSANLTQNLDQLILRVKNMPDLPAQQRILILLEQTRDSVTSNTVKPPPNVRFAITNFGGNSTGITRTLSDRGIKFIDMRQAPRVPLPSSRLYFSKDSISSMMQPASLDEVANTQVRMNRVGAAAVAGAAGMQLANNIALHFQIKDELGKLTKPIAEALAGGGGALVVVNIVATSPPWSRGRGRSTPR